VSGPTSEQIQHYVRMFENLHEHIEESFCWNVLRPTNGAPLTVEDVVGRLGGDPGALTRIRPIDITYDYELVFLEPRGDSMIVAGYSSASAEEPRLSEGATVHGVFWLINNANRLYHAVDGMMITELDALRPHERWGSDPEALTDHLGALFELHEQSTPPYWDWQTALATVESLTGERVEADWFTQSQLAATVNGPRPSG